MTLPTTHSHRIHLPRWAADIIANPPKSGEGFHRWLFRAAHALWKCGREEYEIKALLENAANTCGRCVTEREIEDALRNSRTAAFQSAHFQQRRWPAVNIEQRDAIIRDGGGLVDLWEISPIRFEDKGPHTEDIIDQLFPADSFLCCGKSHSEFDTKPREQWRGQLSELQLIVPNAMSAMTGITRDGRISKHALSNTGPRFFLIIEFDTGTADDHAALLLHLAERAPLALAVHSGAKSLHGWFYCRGRTDARLESFIRYAVSLGADAATWTPSQFVRMPDGMRENGQGQAVYFFNPGVIR
jgi:hypothetical protein